MFWARILSHALLKMSNTWLPDALVATVDAVPLMVSLHCSWLIDALMSLGKLSYPIMLEILYAAVGLRLLRLECSLQSRWRAGDVRFDVPSAEQRMWCNEKLPTGVVAELTWPFAKFGVVCSDGVLGILAPVGLLDMSCECWGWNTCPEQMESRGCAVRCPKCIFWIQGWTTVARMGWWGWARPASAAGCCRCPRCRRRHGAKGRYWSRTIGWASSHLRRWGLIPGNLGYIMWLGRLDLGQFSSAGLMRTHWRQQSRGPGFVALYQLQERLDGPFSNQLLRNNMMVSNIIFKF